MSSDREVKLRSAVRLDGSGSKISPNPQKSYEVTGVREGCQVEVTGRQGQVRQVRQKIVTKSTQTIMVTGQPRSL